MFILICKFLSTAVVKTLKNRCLYLYREALCTSQPQMQPDVINDVRTRRHVRLAIQKWQVAMPLRMSKWRCQAEKLLIDFQMKQNNPLLIYIVVQVMENFMYVNVFIYIAELNARFRWLYKQFYDFHQCPGEHFKVIQCHTLSIARYVAPFVPLITVMAIKTRNRPHEFAKWTLRNCTVAQ